MYITHMHTHTHTLSPTHTLSLSPTHTHTQARLPLLELYRREPQKWALLINFRGNTLQ